ncbi:MAG: hypothetical protein ACOC8F_04875 [Planctomycetota bacterium]
MTQTLTLPVEKSASLRRAVGSFLDAVGAWARRVMGACPEGFVSDSHDGGTFMLPWAVYARAAGDERPAAFMRRYRDGAKHRFEQAGLWRDGYWRRQEVHHGTEHFELFVGGLWRLDPRDAETIAQFEDAAEHVGNWKAGVPAWYDWDTGLFRSMHLGTETVGPASPNVPDHVRLIRICLLAGAMTGRRRYLDLARRAGLRWADALVDGAHLPVAIDADGAVSDLARAETSYRAFAGAAPDDLDRELPRAENLIASGVPDAMLALWQATGDGAFRAAAERIIDVAAGDLASPIAWQAQAAVRRYRDATGSGRYDARVRDVADDAVRDVGALTLVAAPEAPRVTGPLGMRADKPDWLDADGRAAPSPLLGALKALVIDDPALLRRAVDLGRAHFELAARAFGDVTHHGCGSRSLAAVCRGHGRLNGAGVVTEVLAPALGAQE